MANTIAFSWSREQGFCCSEGTVYIKYVQSDVQHSIDSQKKANWGQVKKNILLANTKLSLWSTIFNFYINISVFLVFFFSLQSLDEHHHMMFVLHHLNDILELLMEPGEIKYVLFKRKLQHIHVPLTSTLLNEWQYLLIK